ncbi:hypothetical protein MCEMSE15_02890 [Fimbriimonadaceae bacterium]
MVSAVGGALAYIGIPNNSVACNERDLNAGSFLLVLQRIEVATEKALPLEVTSPRSIDSFGGNYALSTN